MTRVALLFVLACSSTTSRTPPPNPDPDGDRIVGAADRCPNEPEIYNGVDDDDGCPDKPRATREDCVWIDVLEILDHIFFDLGSQQVPERAVPIVDAVAATIIGNPQIQKVGVVGGRAGDEGDQLALARATRVAKALIDRAVEPERLDVQAYDKRVSDDPARNRAVWFVVLRIDGEDTRPPSGDARFAPWDRDCPAKWKAHREQGAAIDCSCFDAKPPL